MSVNKVILIGRLGRDVETKQTSGGVMAKISVATDDPYKNKSGQWESETDWHRVVVFGQPAEYAARHLAKGSIVYIEGKSKTSEYQDRQTGEKRFSHSIKAYVVKGLTKKSDQYSQAGASGQGLDAFSAPGAHKQPNAVRAPQAAPQAAPPQQPSSQQGSFYSDDDIPF